MKKIVFFAIALMGLAIASCQKPEIGPVPGGDTNVVFKVSAGDLATKAIADGTNIDILYWEIYGTDIKNAAGPLGKGEVKDTDSNKEFLVELALVADQEYNIVFWAQVDGQNTAHYTWDDLRNVKINTYDDEMANDETRAAFFAVHNFKTENGVTINETVYLYRPFAQLNLGATTLKTSLDQVNGGNIVVNTTQVKVTNVATSFNTLDGVGEGEQAVVYQHATTPVDLEPLKVNGEDYFWLGMNYLIVNGDSDAADLEIQVKTNMGDVNHIVSNVPIKENYRTNILGNLLTTGATFKVVVDEDFQEPDYIVPTPQNEYVISNVEGLVWLQQQVNKEGNTFAGKTVKLAADIDLQGAAWEPIVGFKGTFDGAQVTKAGNGNYTVSNFNVNVKTKGGLFGSVVGVLKNVNVENVTVKSGHFAGALVGYIYGTVENCHAKNVTVVSEPFKNADGLYDDGNQAGGLVGYICGEPGSYLVNNSVTNATVIAYRDLGSVVGCLSGTMSEVTGNTAKDCSVVVDRVLDGAYNGTKDENAGVIAGRNATTNLTDLSAVNTAEAAVNVVVKSTQTVTTGDSEGLKALVGESGTFVDVPAGEYTFPSVASGVTINCAEGTVFEGTSGLNINGSTVSGATFKNENGTAVSGTIHGTFRNCTFDGSEALRWCYSKDGGPIIFEDCVIKTDFRGFHFDDMAGEVIFRNCEINGFNAYGGAGTITFENCTFGYDKSNYNGLNIYAHTVLKDCKFVYLSGKTNFIDMEGTGKTLSISNCTATLDGNAAEVSTFIGGSKLADNTVIVDGVELNK